MLIVNCELKMKKMMMTMLLGLTTLMAAAQTDKGTALNEKFFAAKMSELVYRLDMTDEQKVKFEPIYRRYCEEMKAIWCDGKKYGKPTTDEERLARTRQKLERQERAQSVRIKYLDEFSTVLNSQQVSRFYEVEKNIQKKLMDRRQNIRHPHKGQHKDFRNHECTKGDKPQQ